MTRFWWVRHGPTHQKTFVGWRDVVADLSDTSQIARLDAYLPQDAVVISSDLIRSIETADAVQGQRPRLPHDPRLKEFNFGAWDGLTFEEVEARDPELSRAFWEHPGELSAPDGESWDMVANRVNEAVEDLLAKPPAKDIVVVAHFGVILTQVQRGIGGDAYKALSNKVDNFSVTDLTYDNGEWAVGTINHLP